MARVPYLGPPGGATVSTGRTPYLGGSTPAPAPKGGGGLLSSIEHVVAAPVHLAGNLVKDVGSAAVSAGPGIYKGLKAVAEDAPLTQLVQHGSIGPPTHIMKLGENVGSQYKSYYGPLAQGHVGQFGHNLYTHPLQPLLDALTVADLGATGAVRLGVLSGERGTLITRSPRNIATGEGPVHTEITSAKPLIRGREKVAAAARTKRPSGTLGVGGEVKHYGKQTLQYAQQHAMENLAPHGPYVKATKGLSKDEWTALHIRAMDIHPDDLKVLWKGTPKAAELTPKVTELALNPSKRMRVAEPAAKTLSHEGETLLKGTGKLTEETAAARPGKTRQQAAETLGRPVKPITGQPYYFPHVIEPGPAVSPLAITGGGKGVPRPLRATKQNQGVLALGGKLHLRSDVLGPEFLRRVKYVKYDEIHNGLVRGAIQVTAKQIQDNWGGKLPKGYEYVREKASTKIPATLRAQGETGVPIDKLIPNAEDLHDSALAEGFSTTNPEQALKKGGKYHIVPTSTVKAATGEFTRSSDFTRNFVSRPLKVWRSVILGLRVGFLTNNLVGNSVMYAVKTGGNGAIRNLFQAILETHGAKVAKQVLDSAATPPKVRADLTKEFFPAHVGQGAEGVGSIPDLAREKGFLYHRSSASQLNEIRKTGLKPSKPAGDNPQGVYFANDPLQARGLSWKRTDNIYLRVAKQNVRDLNESRAFGESLTPHTVPPSDLQYLGADGTWHPMVEITSTPPMRRDFTKEFFPEQVSGTFGRTQSPATSQFHAAGQGAAELGRKVTGAIPRLTSKVAEEYPRRALVRYYIKNSPEFKQVYSALPKQTHTFETAARQVLEGKGGSAYQRYISKQVNQALGDYLHLSATERNVLRNLLPFYSWYKAIATTTYHLAVDTPLRANILGQLGQIGKQQVDSQVPSFLRGAIGLGAGPQGTKRVLSTQGLNPYATLEQLRRGGITDYTALGLNPFIEGPAQYLQRHGYKNISPAALALSPLKDLVKGLPPSQLIAPSPPSKLYPTRSRRTQVLSNLGVPIKEYNPAVAAQQAKQGR